MMEEKLINQVCICIKHKNYDSAIFYLSFSQHPCKNLFMGILYYENVNYHKALSLLKEYNTMTSKYYEALCNIKLKKYQKAIILLTAIVNNKIVSDTATNTYLDTFYITNTEFVFELLGDCYSQNNERTNALKYYVQAYEISGLINSFNNLIIENFQVKLKKDFDYFKDRVNFMKEKDERLIEKYKNEEIEKGSYFLSECARIMFEEGRYAEAAVLFEYIHRTDPFYFKHSDVYSTLLWHRKENDKLAFLCRTLIEYIPDSFITWTALGNYFSLKYDHNRALICFKRSIYINNNHYALSLLGHEYIIKQDYTTAMKYFVRSLKLYKSNYNALFALGVVYSNIGKAENAEYYFLKGIKLNTKNIKLKFMMMQFYNRNMKYEKSYNLFCEALRINESDLEKCVKCLKQRNLSENEEMIALELIDYLKHNGLKSLCEEILDIIKYRGKNYFYKKELVYDRTAI